MISIRKAAVALAIAAVPLASTPAHASPNTDVVVGEGTINPGLPGCNQAVTFTGTAVLAGTHAGSYRVQFDGASNGCEDLQRGDGCGNLSGEVSGRVCYVRTANVVQLSGSVYVGGLGPHSLNGSCQFVPTTVSPTTTYLLTCEIVLV